MTDKPSQKISTFTTRVDTIYAVTFLVIAPEHPLVLEITKSEFKEEVQKYIQKSKAKSERERQINKEKTGVFTGSYVRHPLTKANIPVWVSDYVLANYGTGVVMGVPAHDQRDNEFAHKFGLEIVPVIKSKKDEFDPKMGYYGDGVLYNSEEFDGLESDTAKFEITKKLKSENKAESQINFKFRDWVFSRQRYWGEPFPLEYT